MKKAHVLTNTTISKRDIVELEELMPELDLTIEQTDMHMPAKWNPFFQNYWGDFDWIRERTDEVPIRVFVTNFADLEDVGIEGHIGMYDLQDRDQHTFYIAPDLHNKLPKRNGFTTNFAWLFVHEYLHGKEKRVSGPDRVHEMEEQGRLKELLREHQERREGLRRTIHTLQNQVISLAGQLIKRLAGGYRHPVPKEHRRVTQAYGVRNDRYPKTGHHIGTDYATPVGTELVAPADGILTYSGYGQALGFYAHYRFNGKLMRLGHLHKRAKLGSYRKGEVIAVSGNSGDSTGPHLHIDIWRGKIDLNNISASNFRDRTLNPENVL